VVPPAEGSRFGSGTMDPRQSETRAEKGCWPEGQRYMNHGGSHALLEFFVCTQHHRSTVANVGVQFSTGWKYRCVRLYLALRFHLCISPA